LVFHKKSWLGGSKEEELAVKFRTPNPIISNSLPGVAIETPATLVLRNVDERYDGNIGSCSIQVIGGMQW
jgi:hypothetical protein